MKASTTSIWGYNLPIPVKKFKPEELSSALHDSKNLDALLEEQQWWYKRVLRPSLRKPIELHHTGSQFWGEIESLPADFLPYESKRQEDLEKVLSNTERRSRPFGEGLQLGKIGKIHLLILAQELYCAGWQFEDYH